MDSKEEIKVKIGKDELRGVISEAMGNIYFRKDHIEKIVNVVWDADYRKADEVRKETVKDVADFLRASKEKIKAVYGVNPHIIDCVADEIGWKFGVEVDE